MNIANSLVSQEEESLQFLHLKKKSKGFRMETFKWRFKTFLLAGFFLSVISISSIVEKKNNKPLKKPLQSTCLFVLHLPEVQVMGTPLNGYGDQRGTQVLPNLK